MSRLVRSATITAHELFSPRFGYESVDKMVEWALDNVPPTEQPYILDVGAGNGILLLHLADRGYAAARLVGLDYSEGAVRLASLLAAERERSEVRFGVCDFLTDDPPRADGMGEGLAAWDLVTDKGTFDAISLMDEDANGRAPVDGYPSRVARLLKPGAFFLITCELLDVKPLLKAAAHRGSV